MTLHAIGSAEQGIHAKSGGVYTHDVDASIVSSPALSGPPPPPPLLPSVCAEPSHYFHTLLPITGQHSLLPSLSSLP